MKITRMANGMLIGWLAVAATGYAIDYGAPVYRDNLDKSVRLEGIFNRFDRDVKIGDAKSSMDQDLYMLRLHISGDIASVYFDAGGIRDDRSDGGTPAVLGMGVQILSYDGEYARVNLLGAGHYVPSYDTETDHVLKGDLDYYELGGGAILSGKALFEKEELQLIPYFGMMYSVLSGNHDVNFINAEGAQQHYSHSIKEQDPAAVFGGVAVIFKELVTGRLEYSFLSDSSISAAIGVAF